MASYKSLFRKTSSKRLQIYLKKRIADFPESFDWTQQSTALVSALEEKIHSLPLALKDELIGEIGGIIELTDWAGQKAIEEICRARKIDLDSCEGAHDRALMLALDHYTVFEQAFSEASFRRRTGGKHWTNYSFDRDGNAPNLNDEADRESFIANIRSILEIDPRRDSDADWYEALKQIGNDTRRTYQATIYIEEQNESRLGFGAQGISRHTVPRVGEIGLSYDPEDACLEICAPGRKKQHDEFARAFAAQFFNAKVEPVPVPYREIDFSRLRSDQNFVRELKDRIEHYEVSELVFFGQAGRKASFEKRGTDETIFEFLKQDFGDQSPLRKPGWNINGATIRIVRSPVSGKGRKKTITVDLKFPNRTNIRNRTEEDREFIMKLFERWRIFLPDVADETLFEREPHAKAS